VNFKTLLVTCRDFKGEDLPMVEPKPQPIKVVSVFRSEPTKDHVADYIPVGRMIKSSVLLSQESFFGSTAKDITEQPTIPVTVTDKGAGKLPVFKHYKTEEFLQPRPKQVQADANSLWPDKRADKGKAVYAAPTVLANICAATERSLMAINYFEFFAMVQKKALAVLAAKKSIREQHAAALDMISRISTSMGRCPEDITRQQSFILTSATVVRREAVLHQRKMPADVSDWLRVQPILTGTALFGPVASTAKPLLAEDLTRTTQEKFMSTGSSRKGNSNSSKPKQRRTDSRQSNQKGRTASSTSSASSRPRTDTKSKSDFQRDSYKSNRGGRSQQGKKPFHQRGAQGHSKK
jgi:hypothetical protein